MSTVMEDSIAVLGQEVSLGHVDKALKELWGKDAARTKASLINFAIYSEDPDSLGRNTEILGDITREHSCRGLLILSQPNAPVIKARAWVTAHCQLHDGQKSVCSEQISFLLQGGNTNQMRNIVFAHLDSDLPLAFWWQGDLTAIFDERFYSVIDLLLIDSSCWKSPATDFAKLQEAQSQKTSRFRVYDLSWLRSHNFRTALAMCFADSVALQELAKLQSIVVTHGPGHKLAGQLLAAWIGVRLKAELTRQGEKLTLVLPEGQQINVEVNEGTGSEALQSIVLTSADASFTVHRECGSNYACTSVKIGNHTRQEMLPADLLSDSALIANQLSRLGGQSLYIQMVPMLRKMLD
jgi:glucose-6-phosphate dehydrogenase assembly protein OpcA